MSFWILTLSLAISSLVSPSPVSAGTAYTLHQNEDAKFSEAHLSKAAAITTGLNHICALTVPGGVKCWGNNDHGQLGDGTTTLHYTPADVIGMENGVIAISAGDFYTCALTDAGGVKCWGDNEYGQLGNGTTTNQYTSTVVSGLMSGVIAISAGVSHVCALTNASGVKCWGYNGNGELGDGTTADSLTPMDVSGLSSNVIAISAGGSHTCALTVASSVKCWGGNYYGQLGDGTTMNQHVPSDVSGLMNSVIAISTGGSHTCALTSTNGVKCWGDNSNGQLGDRTTVDRYTPVDVSGLTNDVTAISAGAGHTCALTKVGSSKCWGWNWAGQVGDGTTTDRNTPITVSGLLKGVTAISAAYNRTCALTGSGGVKCWGANSNGGLGIGFTVERYTPTDVGGLGSRAFAIAVGETHTCAVTTADGVKCCGSYRVVMFLPVIRRK